MGEQKHFLRIPKVTLLLFQVTFLMELWPIKHRNIFLGHPVVWRHISLDQMLSHYGQWWGWSVLGGDNLTILQYSTLGVPIISQCPRHTPVCPCVSAPVFMN